MSMIEICVEGFEEALAAEAAGAERVELCAALSEGGITPSIAQIRLAKARCAIPVFVIIRPRGGDFLYTDGEFDAILEDIAAAKAAGADGVVIGFLTEEGCIDIARTREAVATARPMGVTCHRAFDMTRDPDEAIDDLIACGVDRVLSSGQRASARDGIDILKGMIKRADGRIIVMVCGDPDPTLLFDGPVDPKAVDFHFGATGYGESPMRFRNPHVFMGKGDDQREYIRRVLDGAAIAERAERLRRLVIS
ncbi:copper homeostasis protein CutC [Martelella radicis]|uniref:PF03932 family protein CutC n=1 Tax=Martelella radicis TaxID=1397476 RepID=A0A7W6P7J7_9HYPH|nr:copper homeostasis protein CutC [Martelella radicis]MBB4120262.1 copper homeostasis protein [Martelella radicis]